MVSTKRRAIGRASLTVLKLKPGGSTRLRVLSSNVVWMTTHWRGKALICAGEDCPLCKVTQKREKGYVVVQKRTEGRNPHGLLEFSGRTYDYFIGTVFQSNDDLTGGTCIAVSKKKKQSPMLMVYEGKDLMTSEQMQSPTVTAAAISVLYSLPMPEKNESVESWNLRIAHVVTANARAAADSQGV